MLIPLSALFPPSWGLTKGQNDPVEKLVLEDGPERTISVWCESCRKIAGVAGGRAGCGAVPVLLVVTGGEGERRSELDSHVARRRVSMDSQESHSLKGKDHCSRESADFTKVSVLSLL
jgi:hypothetical protein